MTTTRIVYKYTLEWKLNAQKVAMPKGAQLLTVQVQDSLPVVWAVVDPKKKRWRNGNCFSRSLERTGPRMLFTIMWEPYKATMAWFGIYSTTAQPSTKYQENPLTQPFPPPHNPLGGD